MNLAKLTCIAGSFLLSTASLSADLSFQGNFDRDDDVQLLSFSVITDSTVTLRSLGYAGGINAAGQLIPRGGFDTILSLFDGSGTLIDSNDDGGDNVPADAETGQQWDAYLETFLTPGNYQFSIMQFDNFAIGPNLSDGFFRTGQGNYTAEFGCGGPAFCDISGATPFDQRDSHWAFDVLNVNASSVSPIPEPETYAMLVAGLGMLAYATRRRKHGPAI